MEPEAFRKALNSLSQDHDKWREDRKVDFRQIILILTTNTGSKESSKRSLGFNQQEYEDKSTEAINRFFTPEFRNRLSAIIKFNSLDLEVVEMVVDKLMSELEERLKVRKVNIQLSPGARTYLAKKGYDPQLGARPIQRLINEEITEQLTKELLFGDLQNGGTITIEEDNDKLEIKFLNKQEVS